MDSKSNLTYFRIPKESKRGKWKDKQRKGKKGIHNSYLSTVIIAHKRNSELDLTLCFNSIQNSVAFNWVYFYCLGTWEKKTTACRKQRFRPWTINGMATARDVGTAGWFFFINFAHRLKAHNNICLVYTKFNALSYGYKLSLFWGSLSLYMVWCTFSTQLDPPLL